MCLVTVQSLKIFIQFNVIHVWTHFTVFMPAHIHAAAGTVYAMRQGLVKLTAAEE